MRKFFAKLLLALVPLLVYTALFVAYEPYNYWGLKPEKTGNWTTPLGRVRAFLREPSENIILGDSRMNHFDLDYVEELTGIRYANLATGGQGHNLTREMYDWAKSQVEIKSVVLDVSFYQLLPNSGNPSAQPVFQIAKSPMSYLTTRDYVVEAFSLLADDLTSVLIPMANAAGIPVTLQQEEKYRADLIDYAQIIYTNCENYELGQVQIEDYLYIIDDVQKNGGEVTVVLPPVQESIWELVIEPLHLEQNLDTYREILLQHTDLYDMEWKSDFARDQDIFADGFHFLYGDGYQRFTEAIFTGEADFLRILPKSPEK